MELVTETESVALAVEKIRKLKTTEDVLRIGKIIRQVQANHTRPANTSPVATPGKTTGKRWTPIKAPRKDLQTLRLSGSITP
jgi:hypothetical protein